MIGNSPSQNDNSHDMPAYLRAEHAAAILRRSEGRVPTETEVRWARRCLIAALDALPMVGV